MFQQLVKIEQLSLTAITVHNTCVFLPISNKSAFYSLICSCLQQFNSNQEMSEKLSIPTQSSKENAVFFSRPLEVMKKKNRKVQVLHITRKPGIFKMQICPRMKKRAACQCECFADSFPSFHSQNLLIFIQHYSPVLLISMSDSLQRISIRLAI